MSSGFEYDVRHMAQLANKFDQVGWGSDRVTQFGQATERQYLDIAMYLDGYAEITVPEHLIDLDADPFVPDGWKVLPDDEQLLNRVRGLYKWSVVNVALHLDKGQKDGKAIEGNKLREELAKKPVLNANLLDYLLANTHLISEEWKGQYVFFWGTIYRYRDGDLYVRCLHWGGAWWHWGFGWLGYGWDDNHPALVDAS